MSRSTRVLPMILALAGLALTASAQTADGVLREGEGTRRTQLNAMELRPFPAGAWSALTEWKDAKTLSAGDTSGKPVLILTWSSWHPTGARALAAARKAAGQYAKEGLIVVVAHHPEGFADAAADIKKPAEGQLYFALDAKGDFRRLLLSDQDPDFFVIDRAGQLRFGDVVTESVDRALQIVCGETREQAAGLNKQIADSRAAAERENLKSSGIRDSVTAANIPEQPFAEPSEAEYAAVRWPKAPKDPNASSNMPEQGPRKLAFPDGMQFYPERRELKGRGLVVYFWSPNVRASFDGVTDRMDRLQAAGGRDLVVVGVITPINETNTNFNNQPPKELDWNKAIRGRNLQHVMLPDPSGAVMAQVLGQPGMQVPIPYGAVMSSDGTVRYSGSVNAPAFQAAVDAVLRDDPGVKARRDAEEAYLKSKR